MRQNAPALSMRSRREKRKPIPLPEKRSLRRKFLRCKCCLPRLCRLKLRPQDPPPLEPVTDEAAPQPEEKAFAMDYWLAYAKDYAVSIGLVLDPAAAGTWDTPIRCSSKTEDVLAAYIRDDLTYYKDQEGCTAVWIWAEQIGDGQYELFIGRG